MEVHLLRRWSQLSIVDENALLDALLIQYF